LGRSGRLPGADCTLCRRNSSWSAHAGRVVSSSAPLGPHATDLPRRWLLRNVDYLRYCLGADRVGHILAVTADANPCVRHSGTAPVVLGNSKWGLSQGVTYLACALARSCDRRAVVSGLVCQPARRHGALERVHVSSTE